MEYSFYQISPAFEWTNSLSNEEILNLTQDTAFSKEQLDQGRDYCYFLNKYYRVFNQGNQDYALMAYTLNEPETLKSASIYDIALEENETYYIHRINVIRGGKIIDKIPDINIKVLDNEDQSGGGVLSRSKKINVTIKDLRLNDILILEDSRGKTFTEKEFMRRDFVKHIYSTPNRYWSYGKYHYKFINDRDQNIAFKKFFFRDDMGNLLPEESGILQKSESLELQFTNYINPVDAEREIYPFVDFATQSDWNTLSNYIYPMYQEAFNQADLENFAPDLVEKLNTYNTLEQKIQYAIEFVQNNIYYLYNADEMNGHKPQEPAITYEYKQGDCKAKSVLLCVILKYLGVESYVSLVNYNSDFYLKYYLPSLLSFNHVIVKIVYGNNQYFVDCTARNEFGRLEKRHRPNFCYYMDIAPNQTLKTQTPFKYPEFCIDEKITLEVNGNVGKLQITTTARYSRANNLRNHFKNSQKREIIDGWNNALFNNLNYSNDRKDADPRTVFKNAEIQILNDDKTENEITVQYQAEIENPYFVDPKNKRFLMYFDYYTVKNNIRQFQHRDASFWHGYDSERYDIVLSTDLRIDTKEKYTIQECDIKNDYFTHKTKKTITKNSGRVIVEYDLLTYTEIPLDKIEAIKEAYNQVADSNFGIGIDIIEKGFLNSIRGMFK
ncbi:MAG: hypothetical protein Q4B43_02420 [Bacteroidota bacterium]|nr:hypothetical protein [Bacteroidota bacterium]